MEKPTRIAADQLVNNLQATIRGLEMYRATLMNRPGYMQLKRINKEMQSWGEANSTLQFHLRENLLDLDNTLNAFAQSDADLIDLEISKSYLAEKLRVCIQAFSIQMEMVKPVTQNLCCAA